MNRMLNMLGLCMRAGKIISGGTAQSSLPLWWEITTLSLAQMFMIGLRKN